MTIDTAKRLHELLLSASSAIDGCVALAQNDAPTAGFDEYRLAAAQALDSVMEGLLKPIYREYPDLIPPELDREFLRL